MPVPERLALTFLGTFARCEYALKGSGFAIGGQNSVEPDWDRFARAFDWHFRRVQDTGFHEAVEFLLSSPPRKQILRNGRPDWKNSPPNQDLPKAQQCLLMVRRVRNNLFHGAKVWSPEYDNRERDIRLIEASLTVLKHCVHLSEDVRVAYEVGTF